MESLCPMAAQQVRQIRVNFPCPIHIEYVYLHSRIFLACVDFVSYGLVKY